VLEQVGEVSACLSGSRPKMSATLARIGRTAPNAALPFIEGGLGCADRHRDLLYGDAVRAGRLAGDCPRNDRQRSFSLRTSVGSAVEKTQQILGRLALPVGLRTEDNSFVRALRPMARTPKRCALWRAMQRLGASLGNTKTNQRERPLRPDHRRRACDGCACGGSVGERHDLP
jgi:hypothetical protein